MTWISAALLSLLVLPSQDPGTDVKSRYPDVITLKSGERLEGVILTETEDYVEIRLDGRAVDPDLWLTPRAEGIQ